MNAMEMSCDKCAVSANCPSNGSSPLILKNGKKLFCQIIGGFGDKPIDTSILSNESLELVKSNGPCLTVAELPFIDETDQITAKILKIFAPPVIHKANKNIINLNPYDARSHGAEKLPKQ